MKSRYNIKNQKANPKSKFKQGHFDGYKPKKYVGERPIIYRSSYELQFMVMVEKNPMVVSWSSESVAIPYVTSYIKEGKVKKKRREYFIDFVVEYADGTVSYVEVKPWSMTPHKDNTKLNTNTPSYKKNMLKWATTRQYLAMKNNTCGWNKYNFKIVTEKSLGL